MLLFKVLNMLIFGFKCQVWELEKDSSGEWIKKGKLLDKFMMIIENNIEDGGCIYGY